MPVEEKRCPDCGKEFNKMDCEESEVLHYVPALLVVLRVIRQRYKKQCDCGCGQEIKIPEMPIRHLDKGSVSTEFIAAALINKYCDHLPIHRQFNRLLKNCGFSVSESSFCRWRDKIAEQLSCLADMMKKSVLQASLINTDATTAKYRIPSEHHRLVNGNEYVYIGNADAPYNVWDFQRNQSAGGVHAFLAGFTGFVQCDAHGNYDALFSPKVQKFQKPPPLEVGCHAHCRRKFKELEKDNREVAPLLSLWKNLYKIEKDIKGCSCDERTRRRCRESKPLLDELFNGIRAIAERTDFLPNSNLGKAVGYALKNERALQRYTDDQRLSIDIPYSF